ncbi:indolepyruvate ferredoxin oxidoreductase subunit alpha [Chloroflexota bacterium]
MTNSKGQTVTSDTPGISMFMMGNTAIARGAIEAGVQVVASYPGTPSSEITEILIQAAAEIPSLYVEWSVNEKVAMEVAIAASICGVRAMAVMKNVGVNVAHDPLMIASYMGVSPTSGLVLVDADDPGQWSSPTEQDNRYIAEHAYLPVLEPSSVQEAKEMMKDAFDLSEKFGQVFMFRSVTRISHGRSDTKLGEIRKDKSEEHFKRDTKYVCMPAWSRKNRTLMLERFERIRDATNDMPYNKLNIVKGAKLGIIACGISYAYSIEALRWMGLENEVSMLKIGTPHPLPERLVKQILESVEQVLVIEELEPFVENHVRIIANKNGIRTQIHGKDVVPIQFELSVRKACEAISKLTNESLPVDFVTIDESIKELETLTPQRPPTMCAGCPHRASFYVINQAMKKVEKDLGEHIYTGDIGCYSLGVSPPLNGYDMAVCMGGGFGLANGAAHVTKRPIVATLGDSTFFHSGIPAMINAIVNGINITMVVLDNSTTAMTGFQPHPGTGITSMGDQTTKVDIVEIARACKAQFIAVIDPFDVQHSVKVLEQAIRFEGPSVVVARRECATIAARKFRIAGKEIYLCKVDQEKCTKCKYCIDSIGCPAITLEKGDVSIDNTQCTGCGLCVTICPVGAIAQDGGK